VCVVSYLSWRKDMSALRVFKIKRRLFSRIACCLGFHSNRNPRRNSEHLHFSRLFRYSTGREIAFGGIVKVIRLSRKLMGTISQSGYMKRFLTLLLIVFFSCLPVLADVVNFPDPGLEAAVREAISKPTGVIYDTDLVGLMGLNARVRSISDLAGIEYCTDLTYLYLWDNQITDISALSGLNNLTYLELNDNQITNISALSGLNNLTYLDLAQNQIADISVLSGLTNLICLELYDNQITDISALSGLTNLTDLYLAINQITDISALSALTSLTWLGLWGNQISDISALSALTSLTDLTLGSNQISDISPLSALTSLTDLARCRD